MTRNEWLFILLAFVVWRIILQVVAFRADTVLNYQPSFPFVETLQSSGVPRWLYSWNNFDGIHYHTIAKQGYEGFGLIQAFFPVYPLTIRMLMSIGFQPIVASLVIAHIATLASIIAVYLLSKYWWNQRTARWTLLGLLLFPTSFFLITGYTESLFLALILWSYWYILRHQWWLAAVLAGLASGTKVVGVLWSLVILTELITLQKSITKRSLAILIGLLLVSISGFLFYSGYLQQAFDDAIYYLHIQSQFGAGRTDRFVLLPQVFYRSIMILLTARPFDLRYYTYILEFISAVWGMVGLILAWKFKLPRSLILFSFLAFLVPTLTGTFSSLPRYILTIPTSFLVLGPLLCKLSHRSQLAVGLLLVVLTASLLLNTLLFVQGYWIS